MRIVIMLSMVLALAGCNMSNEQRVAAFKLCNDSGMVPVNGLGEIICMAPRK